MHMQGPHPSPSPLLSPRLRPPGAPPEGEGRASSQSAVTAPGGRGAASQATQLAAVRAMGPQRARGRERSAAWGEGKWPRGPAQAGAVARGGRWRRSPVSVPAQAPNADTDFDVPAWLLCGGRSA